MAQITIPGASGTHLTFTVTGDSTINYATAFAAAVDAASANGSLTLNVVNSTGSTTTGSIVLNELVASSATSFTPLTGQYTLIDDTATVVGSALGSDTILAGSDTSSAAISATYSAQGSNNLVTFISGNNTYDGSTVAGVSGDTITGGSGSDTINTGAGSSTVFSGSGTSLITLSDSSTVAGTGDVVFLGNGVSTVMANGINDVVAAAAPGQLIIGGGATADNLTVAIETPPTSPFNDAADTIVARSGATTVYDQVGGNVVYGGAGSLTFVGASTGLPVADTILAGSGSTAIVGFANADLTFASTSVNGGIVVVAGIGNETLNGANATSFSVFGDTTAAASTSSTFVGSYDSTAADYFSTGGGNEAYVAGNATDVFQLDTVAAGSGPAHITIFGFNNNFDYVGFGNDTVNAQKDINSGTVTNGNLTITLSDNTTVTFVGVTSLTGHTIT